MRVGLVIAPGVEGLVNETRDAPIERAAVIASQPLGRLVTFDEDAAAICCLFGPDASSTTGADLVVDGGILGARTPAPAAESDGQAQFASSPTGW
jgi:NAD(P)-dependent dehydrogenase (short-subunit alcohol dehydrogenase family)